MENNTYAGELIQSIRRIDSIYAMLVPHTIPQICFSGILSLVPTYKPYIYIFISYLSTAQILENYSERSYWICIYTDSVTQLRVQDGW